MSDLEPTTLDVLTELREGYAQLALRLDALVQEGREEEPAPQPYCTVEDVMRLLVGYDLSTLGAGGRGRRLLEEAIQKATRDMIAVTGRVRLAGEPSCISMATAKLAGARLLKETGMPPAVAQRWCKDAERTALEYRPKTDQGGV